MCYRIRDFSRHPEKTEVRRDSTLSTQATPCEPAAAQPLSERLQRLFHQGRKLADERKKTLESA